MVIFFCRLSPFGVGHGLLAVSVDCVWALISLLRKGIVLWERRILIIFSRLSTQSDFGWTMLYVTFNWAALVALLLLVFNQGNISYRYDSLPPSHHNIPVNLNSTNWTSGVYTNFHVLWDSRLNVAAFKFCVCGLYNVCSNKKRTQHC